MPSKPIKAIKAMFPNPSSWRIVRGDKVQVMTGKDRGKQGEVMRVVRDQRFPRVFVQGVNMITRRIPRRTNLMGQTVHGFSVQMEAPVHYSNVMLVDPLSKKPVRTCFMFEDQPPFRRVRKTRGKNATNSIIPWPEKWKQDLRPSTGAAEKDTKRELVDEVTYDPTDDFSLNASHYLPEAHIQAQRVKAQRAAAAKEKAALRQQLWRKYRPLLFSSGGTAAAGGGSGGSSSSSSGDGNSTSMAGSVAAAASSPSSARSYSYSSSSGSSSQTRVQQAVSGLSLLMLCSRQAIAGSAGCAQQQQQFQQRLRWCGLAAAPLLL